MSLDVMLYNEKMDSETCPKCKEEIEIAQRSYLFDANITHNLGTMAKELGIYEIVWRPEEVGVKTAEELISPLIKGIAKAESDPAYYRTFDSPNGWGKYEHFIPWLKKYLAACIENPNAIVRVSR